MVGWMDDEALHRTLTTGRATYWSRSRQEYWRKGDTSGHVQHVREVRARLRRRRPAGQGRPGRRRLPHRRPRLLRRRPAARSPEHGRTRRPAGHPATMAAMPTRPRAVTSRPSARSPATAGSSRSPAGCSPTARPRSASTASSPATAPARSCWSPPSTAASGRATRSSARARTPRSPSATAQAHWLGEPPVGVPTDGDPLEALRATIEALHTEPLAGPAAAHRRPGRLPRLRRRPPARAAARAHRDDLHVPELTMMLATDLAVLDHSDGSVLLIANADQLRRHRRARRLGVRRRRRAARRDDRGPGRAGAGRRRRLSTARRAGVRAGRDPATTTGPAVERAKEEIRAGEAFQVVVCQRFEMPTRGRPAGRLPGAAGHQPEPVHVPAPLRRLRRRRLQPRGAGQGDRAAGR